MTGIAKASSCAALAAALAITAMPAGAQTADTAPTESQPAQGGLEDIVVTAQRRAENLQDVPIAVTAVSSESLAARGITTNEALVQVTPALNIGRSGSTPLLFLRGVGNQSGSPGSEPSVPLYIDGVYVLGQMNTLFAFNNIERIEVLRGPQGTLFGRNATGGLIQIVTREPSQTASGNVRFGYSNYNTFEASAYATTGLADSVAIDFSGYAKIRDKGVGRNVVTGEDVFRGEEYSVRSKLLLTPGDNTRITLSGDYAYQDSDIGLVRHLAPGITGLNGVTRWNGKDYDVTANLTPSSVVSRWSTVLKIEQDMQWAQLVSISAYQYNKDHWFLDLDGTPTAVLNAETKDRNRGFTQEIQLQSPSGSSFQWVVGGYYLNSKITQDPQRITGLGTGAAGFLSRVGSVATESYSAFGQATLSVTDSTQITAGLRWTHDEKKLRQQLTTGLGTGPLIRNQLSNSKLTYRLAIDQKLGDDVMIYGTLSRGYKSGEFNLTTINNPPIQPETLDAYEMGLKSELFDRRVRINLAAFYYDFKDLQLSQQLGSSTFTLNAAKARIKGLEAEIELALVDGLMISASGAYVHGRYRDFPSAPFSVNEPYTCALGGPGPNDPNFGNQQCFGDGSGKTTVRTPPFTGNVAINYRTPLAGGELGAAAAVSYTDRFFFEVDNRLRQKAYALVNGELSWTTPSEDLTFRIWAKNLFDKRYAIGASASTADQYAPGEPRTYGGDITFRF